MNEVAYEKLEESYKSKFSEMSITPEGVRYLKLRTLIDTETLKASNSLRQAFPIRKSKINKVTVTNLRKQVFLDKEVTAEQIDSLLKTVYEDLRVFRAINVENLKKGVRQIAEEGEEYWNAWIRVYRNDIRQHIQHHFVRTASIQSYEELMKRIEQELDPVVKGYTVISWFNQWSSAIIEDFILSQPKVVPTGRRIDKVDFFFLDIPFDLKTTFIPDEYVRLSVANEIVTEPAELVKEIQNNPLRLIRWLYENQGEPRFSDSHRLFVVLADAKDLKRSWKLKASFNLIQKSINNFLFSRTSKETIPLIDWEFRGNKIQGKFRTFSDMILVKNG